MAGAKFQDADGWKARCWLKPVWTELVVESGKFKGGAQLLDEMKMTEMGERLKATGRFMKGLVHQPGLPPVKRARSSASRE